MRKTSEKKLLNKPGEKHNEWRWRNDLTFQHLRGGIHVVISKLL